MTLTLGLSGNSVLRSYERSMRRNPLGTKMATCAVGFAAGDIVAQAVARQPQLTGGPERSFLQELDVRRVVRMTLFGSLVAAPQMHVFFTWLDKVCLLTLRTSDFAAAHPWDALLLRHTTQARCQNALPGQTAGG